MPPHDPQERRLTRLYILALSLVAGLSIIGQIIVQQQLAAQVSDARVVNIAGRQRMLSQQMAKLALAAAGNPPAERRLKELRESLTTFRREHFGLLHGDIELELPGNNSPQTLAQLQSLQPEFTALCNHVQALLDKSSEPAANRQVEIDGLLAVEPRFLRAMDALVFLYDRESRAQLARLRWWEFGLLGLTLVVLATEGWLIFRPAVRRVRDTLIDLQNTTAELREAKVTAENASQAKSRFLAVLSHEIRTPLTAVLGLTDLALKGPLPERERGYLEMSRDSGESLLGLLNEALDFAKIEAGKLTLEELPFSLRSSVQVALQPLAVQAERKGLAWRCEIDPDLPDHWVGDWPRLRQILLNLTANAVKFTAHGGIRIRLTIGNRIDDRTYLRGEVEDTGIGIAEDKQASIFQAFTQADSGTTREYGGTGLGLAISSQLAELMGGNLRLESRPGSGSRFWFEVPLRSSHYARQMDAAVQEQQANCPEQAGLRVLVLEDTPANQLILRELLTARGHRVTCLTRPSELTAAFAAAEYDLLLLDLQLPEKDGWQVAGELRAWEHATGRAPLRIVAVTASALPGDQRRCLDAGMNDFLAKPIRPAELELILQRNAPYPVEQSPIKKPSGSGTHSPEGWDCAAALRRLEENQQLWRQLAELFLAEAPTHLAAWDRALQPLDPAAIRRVAHRLLGPAAQLGADSLAAALRDCEVLAESHPNEAELLTVARHAEQVYRLSVEQLRSILP